jgi:hypothetical protein
MLERIKEIESILNVECGKYEDDCGKCPRQAECEEYIALTRKRYYITYDLYFGYCVKESTTNKIVFAGSIEDCNRKCIDFNK